MRISQFVLVAALPWAALVGCSTQTADQASPTVRLFRGELSAEQYAGAVRTANEETRSAEQFEVNRVETRAYNTKTRRYQYLPKDTEQRWNEAEQRWEFTPVED